MDTFVLMNKFKNNQTTLWTLLLLCILGDVALNYHHTKFGDNCKSQSGYMDKIVKKPVNWRPEICLQFKDGFRRRISRRT